MKRVHADLTDVTREQLSQGLLRTKSKLLASAWAWRMSSVSAIERRMDLVDI
ncbi:MAG TPA: hypothetical protein VFZ91_15660 [Allosphingosinicella sp.]